MTAKIVLVGNSRTGKTSIAKAYVEETPMKQRNHTATKGTDILDELLGDKSVLSDQTIIANTTWKKLK